MDKTKTLYSFYKILGIFGMLASILILSGVWTLYRTEQAILMFILSLETFEVQLLSNKKGQK